MELNADCLKTKYKKTYKIKIFINKALVAGARLYSIKDPANEKGMIYKKHLLICEVSFFPRKPNDNMDRTAYSII